MMRDAGDMDGDGRHDLMIFAYDLFCDGDVISFQQGGTGTITNVIQDGSNWVYASPAPLGDLNGDGQLDWGFFDIYGAPYGKSQVELSGGLGTFLVEHPTGCPLIAPDLESVGDLNGDGRDDILVSSYDTGPFTPPPLHARAVGRGPSRRAARPALLRGPGRPWRRRL